MDNRICSVIIPAYRAEKTLAQTLDSVRVQSIHNWEAIVIVDGVFQDDTTLQIAQGYAAQDRRIKVKVNPQNKGVAYSRNLGVSEATAPWVAFLDSDDLFHPQKLERQLALARHTGSPFLCSAYNTVSHLGNEVQYVRSVPRRIIRNDLIRRNVIGCSTVMLRRELIQKYPMRDGFIHEDYLCWLECLQDCDCTGCEEPLVDFRKTRNSRNSNKFRSALGVWQIYRNYLHYSRSESLRLWCTYACMGGKHLFLSSLLQI